MIKSKQFYIKKVLILLKQIKQVKMKCFDFSSLKIFVDIDTFLQNIWISTNRILFYRRIVSLSSN